MENKPEIDAAIAGFRRASLKWWLLIIVLPVGSYWAFRAYSEASEQIKASTHAVISTIFGAVVGAITVFLGQAVYENRKKRLELFAALPVLAHDAVAALLEFYTLSRSQAYTEKPPALWPEVTALSRLEGTFTKFQIEWRSLFRGRRSRAAVDKLRQRVYKTRDYFFLAENLSPEEAQAAIDWVLEQAATALNLASRELGQSFKDPAGFSFVGFRKVTEQDRRELSFKDETAPWERSGEPARHG